MNESADPTSPGELPDRLIDLLRRALELSGVEPLVAESLAREHYGRITVQGNRFEVADTEGRPNSMGQPDGDVILQLAEQIKQTIPAKFLTASD